jgi:AcrR family transcriptional regulator
MSSDPIWLKAEPGSRKPSLTRDAIAAAAVKLADTQGFKAVSMRRVAAELGVGTMSLYHYVRTKNDLYSLIDNAIMGELILADADLPTDDWRAGLRAIANVSKAAWDRHPWMINGIHGGNMGPNGMMHFEQSLAAVSSLELESRDRLHIISLVDEYVLGFVARVAMDADEQDDPTFLDRAADYIVSMLGPGEYPHSMALMAEGDDPRETVIRFFNEIQSWDRFELGLENILDGVEAFLRDRGAI